MDLERFYLLLEEILQIGCLATKTAAAIASNHKEVLLQGNSFSNTYSPTSLYSYKGHFLFHHLAFDL